MTRKKSKHRPAAAGLNPVAKAVSGAQPLTVGESADYTRKSKILAHQAAHAFAQGEGTPGDAARLAAAFNVTALLIEAHGHGAEHVGLLTPWRDAIFAIYVRADGVGGVGELAAISQGLELHDALLDTVTLAEMAAVLTRLREHAAKGLLMEVPR